MSFKKRVFTQAEKNQFAEDKKAKMAGLQKLAEKAASLPEALKDEMWGVIVKRYGGARNAVTGHTYSPRNTIMAIMQVFELGGKPFGIFAGFQQWAVLGYRVISGEGSGISILLPRMAHEKNESGEIVVGGQVWFAGCKTVTVFDFSQVAPIDGVEVTPFAQIEEKLKVSESTALACV